MFSYKAIDRINKTTVVPNTIALTPNVGIKKNPAKNVPNILPIVDNDDVLPDISPTFEYSLSLNFTANGDTVAITKLGIPNIIADVTNAINTKLFEMLAKFFTSTVSNIGIRLVVRAPNSIVVDKLFILGSLSALFPPNQYPILMLISITPMIVVHIRFELPTYGDKTLAAISSNIIPIAPHMNTVISNIYFFIYFKPFFFC